MTCGNITTQFLPIAVLLSANAEGKSSGARSRENSSTNEFTKMQLRLHNPDQEPIPQDPPKLTTSTATRSKRAPVKGKWTIIARGTGGIGLRFFISAANYVQAMERGGKICRAKRFEFVAAFAGHMRAMQRINFNEKGEIDGST